VNIVPKKISFEGEIEIRGELYMPISVFNKQSEVFANARNAVAGIIKRKEDRTDCGIKFLAYDLIGSSKETMVEKLENLSLEGFNIPYWRHFKDTFFMQTEYEQVLEKRNYFDYEMDGIVFRIDEDEKYFEMGFTSHHPKGAIAYKFQGDYGETYLRNVQWRISRTGCLNPIAIVDPIKLSGANVTKITLHHAGMIKTRNITINAKVLTVRRGGVIPHLEKVLIPGDTPVLLPDTCPQCGNTTRLEGDFLYCNSNGECSLAHRIMHFISSMDIEGIGLTWIEKLIDEGLLNSIPDLYRLQRQDLIRLENVSDTRADQWLSQISRSSNIELSKYSFCGPS
jgi:DNA ligase (NAD+)